MAEFVIYQSEFAVRSENVRLKKDLEHERTENARLRQLCGEAPRILPVTVAAQPAAGESFKAGNCTVSIGAAPANAPALNPMIAAARAPRQPARATPIPVVAKQEEKVDTDEAVLRFSMVELK